jgi:transcriptional regulator with XRE-family HTH domain/DNA-binding transcriptional MerR regulator
MPRKTAPLLPATQEHLRSLGDRLRLARLRRRLTAKDVAQRAGMSPMTLRSLERGSAAVTIGACLAVMQVLGIEDDLDLVAQTDVLGRELQDARLRARHRSAGFTTHSSRTTSPTKRTRTDFPVSPASEQSPRAVRSSSGDEPRREVLESADQIDAGSQSEQQMRKTLETPEKMRRVIPSHPEEQPHEELSTPGTHANEFQKRMNDPQAPANDFQTVRKDSRIAGVWTQDDLETPAKELQKAVKDLETPAKELQRVVKDLETPAKEIRNVLKDSEIAGVGALRDLEAPAKELQKLMSDLEVPAKELQKMMRDLEVPGKQFQKMLRESEVAGERIRKSLLTSAELAKLIDVPPVKSKKRQ